MFPAVPEISPSYRAGVVPGEGVFFLSDKGGRVFEGGVYEALVPRVDGLTSADDLSDLLSGECSAAEVYYALSVLSRSGCIVESDPRIPREEVVEEVSPPAVKCAVMTIASSVCDRSIGSVFPDSPTLDEAEVVLLALDDYLLPESSRRAQELLRIGKRVLPFRAAGETPWIGPLLVPGETPCFECLRHRVERNRPLDRLVLSRTGTLPSPPRCSSGTVAAVLRLALRMAEEGVRQGEDPVLLTLDLQSGETAPHPVVRRPQCPACGRPEAPQPQPLRLAASPKLFTADGGHRVLQPEETILRFSRHVSPVTGIVSELRRVDALAGPAEVFLSGQNRAFSSLKGEGRRHLRSMSAGKGKTAAQARAGALCEAIERYSGMFSGEEYVVRGRMRDFGADAIHPNACMLFSELQYREREERNAANGTFHRIPEPFDPELETVWAPVWSLSAGRFRYLPAAAVYFHSDDLQDASVLSCFPDSNGNAAGNCMEEAVLQGMLELVERDAVALWWYNRLRVPGVDLSSFGDPYLDSLQDYYLSLGREIWALDITSDLGIPAFAALSRRTGEGTEDILLGFGCHLDPATALVRAFCEMNQFLPRALSRNCAGAKWDADIAAWFDGARVASESYLLPDPQAAPSSPQTFLLPVHHDLLEDVLYCTRKIEELGMEVLVLDQSRPDVGLPVVKVIVPGLRHFWGRLAPGRLYDVPVSMGRLAAPSGERELNPYLMFV
ncbi:MAG TPA: TOMM precursor leader peptide-binding protein [Verrucomicrobiae bacterium]|nr:TOMM precursor leader peptide-binding protein [Verrucomicrobiae bacterium]